MKAKKQEEIKELKKTIVNQKEAVKFESRYKKIKFTGKSSCFLQNCLISFRKTKGNPKTGANTKRYPPSYRKPVS